MRERSKMTANAIARMYAIMAATAAQKAVDQIGWREYVRADEAAAFAVKCIDRSNADAVKWFYKDPKA